jgi:hypothetical protein
MSTRTAAAVANEYTILLNFFFVYPSGTTTLRAIG